mmetsp:Transcript_74050/g.239667  ORF Transcript_74050/g.239667 Transcript_74050/m.239667 type:complete len:202 (+) Transcript_74050:201-806(+)
MQIWTMTLTYVINQCMTGSTRVLVSRKPLLCLPCSKLWHSRHESKLQDFGLSGCAQGHMIGLARGPLDLQHLAASIVRVHTHCLGVCSCLCGRLWVELRRWRAVPHVPDQSRVPLRAAEQMILGAWRPHDGVGAGTPGVQLLPRDRRSSDVDDQHNRLVHCNAGNEVLVIGIPRQAQQRSRRIGLVNDGRVLEIPLVEHTH